MKLIEACVRPDLVDKVIRALGMIKVHCISAVDVKAIGKVTQEQKKEYSVEYGEPYVTMSKIKVFCDDSKAQKVFDTIKKQAYTGHPGDGMISILSLDVFEKI